MEFKNVLSARKSTRSYTSRTVSADEIKLLLSAAISAPSACNMQSWHFYVITDGKIKTQLKESGAFSPWAADAPVIFIICTDGDEIVGRFGKRAKELFIIQDTAAATENLLLCAADLRLGGCWMGSFNEDICRKVVGVADNHRIVAVVPVGEPAAFGPDRPRKPLSQVTTYLGMPPIEITEAKENEPYKLAGEAVVNSLFTDLDMTGVTFDDSDMIDAKFSKVSLQGARFTDCDFTGATADGINISDAIEFYKNNRS